MTVASTKQKYIQHEHEKEATMVAIDGRAVGSCVRLCVRMFISGLIFVGIFIIFFGALLTLLHVFAFYTA